jgi:hypothetical protein
MADFLVCIEIKEGRGRFSPVIDRFKGTPDEAANYIKRKYGRKNVLDWFAEPFNVIDQEFNQKTIKREKE